MKYMYLSLCATFFIIFMACTPEPSESSLSINLSSLEQDEVQVFNIEKALSYTLDSIENKLSFDNDSPMLLSIKHGYMESYAYLKPGEHVALDTISGNARIIGTQSGSPENKFIVALSNSIMNTGEKYELPTIAKLEPDSFLLMLDQKFESAKTVIAEVDNNPNIDPTFKSILETRLQATIAQDLLTYKQFYNYFNKKEPTLPDGFFDQVDHIDFSDSNILAFQEGKNLLQTWAGKDIDYEETDSYKDYCIKVLASLEGATNNELVKNFLHVRTISDMINFGPGIDEAASLLEDYNASYDNVYLKSELDKVVTPWLNLKSGMAAPNFKANTRDGKEVKLSDLKGKKVYVDVWATWCGPCIAEVPYLKELEEELHGENIEFVSVSIDDIKDTEKWKNFIDEKQLSGVQLMAENAWQSDVVLDYNIKGIPRFLMIDEENNIISSNATRPSDPTTKTTLMN